jgi:hypothetical protein
MSTSQAYTVRYHYEAGAYGGKKVATIGGEERQDHVIAATGDAATITAVLNANGRGAPAGAVLVIDSIGNAGPSSFLT